MAAKKVTKAVATEAAVKTAAPKAEEKKEAKAPAKKAEEKKEVKAPAKKAEEKKEAKAPAKKATATVHVQFAGKSYSQDDLMQMAKDVWEYDLQQKPADLVSVELYVKPEECMVYYVMNKEITGSFII